MSLFFWCKASWRMLHCYFAKLSLLRQLPPLLRNPSLLAHHLTSGRPCATQPVSHPLLLDPFNANFAALAQWLRSEAPALPGFPSVVRWFAVMRLACVCLALMGYPIMAVVVATALQFLL